MLLKNLFSNLKPDIAAVKIRGISFDSRNTKKGDLSGTIYSCGENYVVVSLSGINDEGNKPRHLVKEEIYQELLDQKRFNLAAARIPMGSTLEEVASIFDAKIDVSLLIKTLDLLVYQSYLSVPMRN